MTDDDHQSQEKSWLTRLTQVFSLEPKTQEDVAEVLRTAHSNKILDTEALEIMEGALHVSDQQVREIMVSRSQMVVISVDAAIEDVLAVAIESNHSRFPVIGESMDDIRGILLAKDLLQVALDGKEGFSLHKLLRPATIIPESKRLNVLLREFREQRYHMAVVVDEYGSVSGLVTIEDVLEEIVGDIEDETDDEEDGFIHKREDGSYQVAALTPIEDFNETFKTGFSEEAFDTIGGILLQSFGHFPKVGDSICIENFTFKVLEGDNRQIRQLEVTRKD
ncbi:MAG: CBS domain-containing protein [Porticoccaceae bacterium]|nr:CBS domain-containing protein [Porticoccaceae bacterium]